MKKNGLIILSITAIMITGCAGETAENSATIANPWTDSDREGVLEATGFDLEPPTDAEDVAYSYMQDSGLAQMTYTENGNEWTYRMQFADELTDISGMNYDWTIKEEGTVSEREAQYLAWTDATGDEEYIDDVTGVQVVNWYDVVPGVTYSLSVSGDTNGIDLQVYAEDIFVPLQGEVTGD